MRRFLLLTLAAWIILCSGAEPENLRLGIPREADLLLQREAFSIGYSHRYRQPLWVSYILTADQLGRKQLKRQDRFYPDPEVLSDPVQPREYRKSGYDKGHLAPAADMSYAALPLKQSFFMSNISPQLPGCNRGIWKRLETKVREWARRDGCLWVITGPVFQEENPVMGPGAIPVPVAFYKVILSLRPPMKMIGFLIPNRATKQHLRGFAVSVDMVELRTGCDFFSRLPDYLEFPLESRCDYSQWEPSAVRAARTAPARRNPPAPARPLPPPRGRSGARDTGRAAR